MNTKALVTMMASIIAANAVLADDWTVEEDTRLSADKTVDTLTVNAGVTLDLNGYKLTCSALAGSGTITRTGENDDLTSPDTDGTHVTWSTKDGEATGSYNDLCVGANLFNNVITQSATNDNDKRMMLNKSKLPLVVTYDFGEGEAKYVNKYKIYFYRAGGNYNERGPKAWTLDGSNDKDKWDPLDSQTNVNWKVSGSSPQEFPSNDSTAYRYLRITFTDSNSTSDNGFLELNQLEFFNTNPGELHVNVPSGETTNSTVAISGNVKVVKEGLGTFIPSKTGQNYTGGTEIVAGTVKALTIGGYSGGYAFGPEGSKIIVSTNATSVGAFDVNGQARYGGYDFVLNGGTVKNTLGLTNNSGKLIDVSLLADSMFDFAQGTCGFYDPNKTGETKLDLAGHTLTLSGAGGTQVEHLTVTSQGKILVADGFVKFYGRNGYCPTNDLRTAVLETGTSGQVIVQKAGTGIEVKLGDYICNTAATDTGHDSNAYLYTPKVYGTFKPNTDYFHGVELQDGATIDLSGRTTALPLRGLQYPSTAATATSLHTVTFAAPVEPAESITIYVKLGERGAHGKLISWNSIPSGVNFVSASGEKERSFLVTNRGLSLSTGFKIIFR